MTDDERTGVENEFIADALAILERRLTHGGRTLFNSPADVRTYAALRMAELPREFFDVMFLEAQHKLIVTETMFMGTLTQTSVYPREVVKRCLELNCAAVIFLHNHPSGNAEPSRADEALTQTLKTALSLFDVRVIDHIVVGGTSTCSMAERGLI